MNMITTAFPIEVDALSKKADLVSKLVSAWEKKNSKAARAGGLSLMALSLAACGAEDETPFAQSDIDAATAPLTLAVTTAEAATAAAQVQAATALVAQASAEDAAAAAAIVAATAVVGQATAQDAAAAAAIVAAAELAAAQAATVAAQTATTDAAAASAIELADAAAASAIELAAAQAATAAATALKVTAEAALATAQASLAAETALKVAAEASLAAEVIAKAAVQATYDALIAPTATVLTTGNDIPTLSVGNDTLTGTSLTFTAGDVLVDGSSTDSDTLTITATTDIAATPTVVNIENIAFNIGTALSGGDTTFNVDMANIGASNVAFDVTSADSLIAALSLTNVGSGVVVNASSELVTIAIATAADADVILDINADSSISTTGTADDLTIRGGTTLDVTLTASTATEDLVVTGLDNNITAAGILGTVDITSAGDTTLNAANVVGNVTIVSGDDTTLTSAAASTGVVDITSAGVIIVTNATAAGTLIVNNTGAVSGEDITVTDANSATTATITSVGAVTATANAGFAAATLITATVAEASAITADAVADQVINLNADASGVANTPEVNYTLLASTVETLNLGGTTAIQVTVDAADISTETVTTTNASTAALNLGTANAADLTNVDAAVEIRLGADFDNITLTTDNSNNILLDTETAQTAGTAAVIIDHVTAGTVTSTNTATIGITDSDTTNTDVTANAAGLTFTDVNDLTFNLGTNSLASSADITGADLETVTVTGSGAFNLGALTISGNAAATLANVTLDASTHTGVTTMRLDNTANGVESITTGTAADQISIGAAAASGNAFSVTSGLGADRVTMGAASSLTFDGGSGTDTLTIAAGVDISANVIELTSVEQIEVVGGGGANTIAGSDVTGKTFIIAENGTGTGALAINMDAATVDISNFAFAASFATGVDAITMNGSTLGLSATITGSSGDDNISGSATGDVLTAGGGVDTIASGAGADVINLTETTAAADIIQIGNSVIGGADVAFGALGGSDTITGFNAGATDDVLTFDTSAMGLATVTNYVGAIGALAVNSSEELVILTGAGYASAALMEDAVAGRVTTDTLDMMVGYFNTTTNTTHFVHLVDAGADNAGVTDVVVVATLADFTTQALHDTLDTNNIAAIA
jgi:hypothetical protein